jgi:hypothetical protein
MIKREMRTEKFPIYIRIKNRKIEDERKFVFEQQLILLEKIGDNYKKAGEIEISEILKRCPYK